MNSVKCRDHGAIGLLAADRERRRRGQAIGFHAPQDQAARLQECIGGGRAARGVGGKMHQQEIADARRHLEAKRRRVRG